MPSEKIGIGPIDPHVIIYVPSEMLKNTLTLGKIAFAKYLIEKKMPNTHVQVIVIPTEMLPALEKMIANNEPLQGDYTVLKPFQKHKITDLDKIWIYIKEEDKLIPLEDFLIKY